MAFQTFRDPQQRRLYLLAAILFISYLCIAIALPVIPVYVTGTLKLGNMWAGLGVGIAFLSTIVSRGYAGGMSDQRGTKVAVQRGLALYVVGGLVSLISGLLSQMPAAAYLVLIAGRLLLGLGESLVAVGIISWGIGIVGPQRSGKVLALVGAAIYGALAVGGPIGLLLLAHLGFAGTMAVGAILPLLGLIAISRVPAVPVHAAQQRPPLLSVIGRIWLHGAVICLQGIGFAAIGAFFTLYFQSKGWAFAGLGLTAFGVGFVMVRILFGHLPDRFGGLAVAMVSLAVEAIGQALIWSAGDPSVALIGAFMTGLGCSMIFPAMGREVVHLVAPHLRGTALGGFSAFQDASYGLTGPLAGLLADRAGYDSIFFVGGITATFGLLIATALRRRTARAALPEGQ
ncbi:MULTISPECIES: arabinose transporter [unclassified Rhizobium]|uniref:arabinose transporter n=1 Tax=unclassified Rhizobium TaxID=2613769 RepID=UPI001ADB1CC3|nr:arabinose transporter [Rhizobium sp. 16-488-2b]MBO9176122.1 arabinose transporter [Rhizobium sp. 16-488-2a]